MLLHSVVMLLVFSSSIAQTDNDTAVTVANLEAVREIVLQEHNKFRLLHNSPPLEYDEFLNDYAQAHADNLAFKDIGLFHSNGTYGENMYLSTIPISARTPIRAWYSENTKYDYTKNTPCNFEEVGHFTQLIWEDSELLGVGYAITEKGKIYFVAIYEERGNIAGHFIKNVGRPVATAAAAVV